MPRRRVPSPSPLAGALETTRGDGSDPRQRQAVAHLGGLGLQVLDALLQLGHDRGRLLLQLAGVIDPLLGQVPGLRELLHHGRLRGEQATLTFTQLCTGAEQPCPHCRAWGCLRQSRCLQMRGEEARSSPSLSNNFERLAGQHSSAPLPPPWRTPTFSAWQVWSSRSSCESERHRLSGCTRREQLDHPGLAQRPTCWQSCALASAANSSTDTTKATERAMVRRVGRAATIGS